MKSFNLGLLTGIGLFAGASRIMQQQSPRITAWKNLNLELKKLKHQLTDESLPILKDLQTTLTQSKEPIIFDLQQLQQQLKQLQQDLPTKL